MTKFCSGVYTFTGASVQYQEFTFRVYESTKTLKKDDILLLLSVLV